MVPNFARKPSEAKVAKVVVDKSADTVRALDGDGKLISFYPASVGSEARPSPSGTRTIHSVTENPTYTYSPKLHFKGVKATKPFTIAPGPNNPVGNTWIDLGDSRRPSARPNRTAACISRIGTPRRWARWSTGESRSSSSTECSRRIVRHLGDAGGRERPDALFVGNDGFFNSRRVQFVHQASHHWLPAIYTGREFSEIGGLMSYGTNIADAFRQAGVYCRSRSQGPHMLPSSE
jgi:hypothetical protein